MKTLNRYYNNSFSVVLFVKSITFVRYYKELIEQNF